jgi:hypothetical protein
LQRFIEHTDFEDYAFNANYVVHGTGAAPESALAANDFVEAPNKVKVDRGHGRAIPALNRVETISFAL